MIVELGNGDETTADSKWLQDDDGNCVLVVLKDEGTVDHLCRYGKNDPDHIIAVIEGASGVRLRSEEEDYDLDEDFVELTGVALPELKRLEAHGVSLRSDVIIEGAVNSYSLTDGENFMEVDKEDDRFRVLLRRRRGFQQDPRRAAG